MKKYQELLKTRYKYLELISPLEMLDCISMRFINLTMLKKEKDDYPLFMFQRDERYDNVTLAEALDVDNQEERKVTLILGGPGMGKSLIFVNNGQKVIYCKNMMLLSYYYYVTKRYNKPKLLRTCY